MISGDSTYYYYQPGYPGIEESLESSITVFPNPCKGKFTTGCKDHPDALEVFDAGVRIYADLQINRSTAKEIDLSGYPKGMYLVKIRTGNKIFSRKIMID